MSAPTPAQIAALATTTERRRIVAWLTEERDECGHETVETTAVWDFLDSLIHDLDVLIEASEEEAP